MVVFGRPCVRGRVRVWACGCGRVAASWPLSQGRIVFVARRIGIKEAHTAHTLTVCSFLQTRCWNKIMSCVQNLLSSSSAKTRSSSTTGHVLPDICFMVSPSCIIVIVICSVVTHRLCLWLVSTLSFLLPCCLCSVDRALTESGDCCDVWNVWYGSARYTTGSRRGTHTSIRQNSLLSSFTVRSELIVLHNASALAQESATRIQTELHSSFTGHRCAHSVVA